MSELEKLARECAEQISRLDGVTGLLRQEFAAIILRHLERATEGLKKERAAAFTTADMLAEALRSGYGLKEAVKRWNDELANPAQGIKTTVVDQLRAELAEAKEKLKNTVEAARSLTITAEEASQIFDDAEQFLSANETKEGA